MDSLTTLLTDIARRHLFIETLVTRNGDSLDFHNVSVWSVEAALREAYRQGAKDSADDTHQQSNQDGFGRSTLIGGYTMKSEGEVEQMLEDLSNKLNAYCDANGLDHLSADELLSEQLSIEPRNENHIAFLKAFIEEWEGVEAYYTQRT